MQKEHKIIKVVPAASRDKSTISILPDLHAYVYTNRIVQVHVLAWRTAFLLQQKARAPCHDMAAEQPNHNRFLEPGKWEILGLICRTCWLPPNTFSFIPRMAAFWAAMWLLMSIFWALLQLSPGQYKSWSVPYPGHILNMPSSPRGWRTAMVVSHLRPCRQEWHPKDSRGKRRYPGPEDFKEQKFYLRTIFLVSATVNLDVLA